MTPLTRSRRAILLATAMLTTAPAAAMASSLTVTSDQTVTTATNVGGTDTVTVSVGGNISVGTPPSGAGVVWSSPATGAGVTVINNGAISGGLNAIGVSGNVTGDFTITNNGTMTALEPISLLATNQFLNKQPATGTETLTNAGVIDSTYGSGLAVLFGYGSTDTLNEETGASIRGRVLDASGGGTINLSGSGNGTIYGYSQGINNSTGLATTPGWDGFTSLNVESGNWTLAGSGELGDGASYNFNVSQGATFILDPTSTPTAFFTASNTIFTNAGTVTELNGDLGSTLVFGQGINAASAAVSNVTINNLSTGIIQSLSTVAGGDDRALVFDGNIAGAVLNNAGRISGGSSNIPEDAGGNFGSGAVIVEDALSGAPSGVTINNLQGGVLQGIGASGAVIISQGYTGDSGSGPKPPNDFAPGNVTINNQGAITGGNVVAAIALLSQDPTGVNKLAATSNIIGTVINNEATGTIDGSASGYAIYAGVNTAAVTVTNAGTIKGSVILGSGDDVVNMVTGSSVTGRIIAGAGNNTLNLLGAGSGTVFGLSEGAQGSIGATATGPLTFIGWDGFSTVNVEGGTWNLVGGGYYNILNVATGAVFNICDLPSGATCGSFVYNGANGIPSDGGLGPLNSTLTIVNNGTINNYSNDQRIYYDPTSSPQAFLLSGTGSYVARGSGTLYLSPASSIVQSSVEIAGGKLIDAGTVTVANALQVDAGATFQLGSGGDLKNLNGVVVDNGATGTVSGAIIDNGSFVVSLPSSYTITGAFSGNGALIDNDPGVLTFSGPYGFTGATTINGGGSIDIAQLAANANLDLVSGTINLTGTSSSINALTGTGGTVNVATGDTLTIFSGAYGGTITGGGALVKEGTGTLDLTGTDSLTGPAEVAGGTLQIDGALTTPTVTVDSGATLGGAGTITGVVTVASGGVFSPGDPVTTNVTGAVTFSTGSSYFAQVTAAGASDLIAVTGPVTIQHGASVEIDPLGLATTYGRLTNYTILTATGGVTGAFSSVTSDAPLLTPYLTYTADAVGLSLVRNDISFASLAATRNQAAAAAAVEAGGFGSTLYSALVVQTTAGAQQGYDALSGEMFASLPTILLSQSDQTRRTLTDRMTAPSDARGVWGEAIGSWASFDGTSGIAGARSQLGGLTIGVDDTISGWRLGVAGSYEQDNIDIADRASRAKDQAEGASLYASRTSGPVAARLGASYAWHRIDSSRSEAFPGFSDHTTVGFDAGTAQAFGEVGYTWTSHGASVEPFVGISYDEISTQSAKEAGGPAALAVAGQSKGVVSTRVGLRTAAELTNPNGPDVSLHGSVTWRHAADNFANSAKVSFEGTGQAFVVSGLPVAQDAAEITAGISAKAGAHGRIDLSYSGEIASRLQDHGVKLLASWTF
jgi:outer membrane autotransporter protein